MRNLMEDLIDYSQIKAGMFRKKLDELDTYINGYVNHYTIALNALNEIQKKYEFFDRLLEEKLNLSFKYLSYMENDNGNNSHDKVPIYSQIPLEYRESFRNLHKQKIQDISSTLGINT